MLEYFTYKKAKQHAKKKADAETDAAKEKQLPARPAPILTQDDEQYLTKIISAEGPAPPLPDRPSWWGPTAGDFSENDLQMILRESADDENRPPVSQEKGKGRAQTDTPPEAAKPSKKSRFSFLYKKDKTDPIKTPLPVSPGEAAIENAEMFAILDDLNLSAVNSRAVSLSKESQELVKAFTFVLKDLINGVPTAYDDLTHLLDDSQGTLEKSYDHLPSYLQKLITSLPSKITSSLAPELMVHAQKAGLNPAATEAAGGGLAGAAKAFLTVGSLQELVTKPGAVVKMLKYIMNALKLRWPAFMGTNVLLSLGLFVLLFVFWYCHKRGREVRLGKTSGTATPTGEAAIPPGERITTLEDDPMLPSSESRPRPRDSRTDGGGGSSRRRREGDVEDRSSGSSRRREDSPGDDKRDRDSRREKSGASKKRRDREGDVLQKERR